ncbi:unnamed protein product [Paramecium octaurelia]|uniref:Urocanase N-terminal domain-containing protein n=1 Tax=Paramecium octaurelia TaxID=43137 RepID=A0A8S1TYH0_PAROT|nr:unnamed protein product [Paramecium octaurelia]
MYRLIPDYEIKVILRYPCKCIQAQVIMHMIMNNLNHEVAQLPHQLITYGYILKICIVKYNESVFQNRAQYHFNNKMFNHRIVSQLS